MTRLSPKWATGIVVPFKQQPVSYFQVGWTYSFRCGNSHIVGRVLRLDALGVVISHGVKYDSVGTLADTWRRVRAAKNPRAVAGNNMPHGSLLSYLSLNNGSVCPLLDAQDKPISDDPPAEEDQ